MYWEGIEREEDTFHSLLFLLFFLFLHPRKLHLLIREILSLFCQEERNKLTVCLWKSAFHFSFLIIFIEFIFFKKTIPWTVTPSIETWYTEKKVEEKREMKSCIQSDKNHHHPRSSSGAFSSSSATGCCCRLYDFSSACNDDCEIIISIRRKIHSLEKRRSFFHSWISSPQFTFTVSNIREKKG